MTDWSSKVHDLHPPGDRPALRGQAAELLIQATNPVHAGSALFELIAVELKLNAFLLYVVDDGGHLEFIAHSGLSEAEAAIAAEQEITAFGSGGAPAQIPLIGHIIGVQELEDGGTFLRSLGLKAWFGQPLMAGERLLGVLGFGRRWADRFQDEDLAFLQSVAHYFALALGRLRGEAALHESEERLRLAVEAAGFGVFEYDVEQEETVWSPELREIYGFGPDEIIDPDKASRQIHPDDRQRFLDPLFAVRAGRNFRDYSDEFRIFRPDGEMRWITTKARQLFAPGLKQPKRIIGVVQEITERKLAEQRLRDSEERLQRAQEMGDVASFEWDPLNGDTWVSESYRRIFGLSPGAAVNWEVWKTLVFPEDWDNANAWTFETGETQKYEYRIIRPSDGQVRWIWTACGAWQDPSTGAKRLSAISIDITERKRNEERERLLSREVDHRAKNLLSVVQGMVQLTQAGSIPEFVDQVKGRIHALGRVHGLLAASRWNGAELSKLVEEELAPFADDGERVRLEGPSVALRPAAAQSIALVIHELTTNAAKYGALSSPDGQVEVIWEAGEAVAGALVLRWSESHGPPVVPPQHFGFGLTSIRASIERQLGGTLDLQWLPEGLQCQLVLPSRQLVPD